MDIFEVIIEAGIGFAGFAGVVIALSGDSKYWMRAEKTRMGLMLTLFLTPLFTSFLTLILGRDLPPETVGIMVSIFAGVFIIFSCVVFFLLARKFYGQPGTTYSIGVALFGQITMISVSLFTLVNAFYKFAPPLTVLSGLLVWSMLIGSIIFLRILFLRPGRQSRMTNESDRS